jgi:regulator of ribonuclease activity A
LRIVEPILKHFGGTHCFYGGVETVRCGDDNSRVAELVQTEGRGRVMVVDSGGATNYALLGDRLAQLAADNGWAGIVIYGCVRDVEILESIPLGIMAVNAIPRKTIKRNTGNVGVAVSIGDTVIQPGDWLYADRTGVLIADEKLT